MEKDRKIKVLAITALIITILGLTVAFAALSQTLTINGAATLDAAKWGIKFENLSDGEITGDATINDTAVIADDLVTINNIDVSLSTPGDSVTYTVDLVNEGTINAEIYSIETPTLTEEQERYINFTVTYDDGEEVKQGDILNQGERKNITIKIEFDKDITDTDLPSESQEISLSYKLNFVQTDKEETETTTAPEVNNCTKFENKATYSVGDVIAICNNETGVSEDFYVIHDDGDSVTALAKYDILVGYELKLNGDGITDAKIIDSSIEGYGLQNEQAGFIDPNASIIKGTLIFSEEKYWLDVDNHLKPEYGESYPIAVYDSNSNLYTYVENYVRYLKSLGKSSVSARLLSYNEAINLGCDYQNRTCENTPSWAYSTSYWIDYVSSSNVYGINNAGSFSTNYWSNPVYGLRPVIKITKTEL